MAYHELVKNFNKIRDYMRCVNFIFMDLRAGRNIRERVRVLMTMNAADWKIGWGIIYLFDRGQTEKMFFCLLTAVQLIKIPFIKLSKQKVLRMLILLFILFC